MMTEFLSLAELCLYKNLSVVIANCNFFSKRRTDACLKVEVFSPERLIQIHTEWLTNLMGFHELQLTSPETLLMFLWHFYMKHFSFSPSPVCRPAVYPLQGNTCFLFCSAERPALPSFSLTNQHYPLDCTEKRHSNKSEGLTHENMSGVCLIKLFCKQKIKTLIEIHFNFSIQPFDHGFIIVKVK